MDSSYRKVDSNGMVENNKRTSTVNYLPIMMMSIFQAKAEQPFLGWMGMDMVISVSLFNPRSLY